MSELLLIDDDQELCELLGSWLTQEGFTVRACHDGLSARQALAEHAPAAVVLDVMLPDGSGLELLKQLRSEHADLPVLMLSARGEPLDRILGLELGADDYLAKPCDPRELTARLRAVLRRSQPKAAAAPMVPIRVGALEINPAEHSARVYYAQGQATPLPLTLTEFRLLALLASQPRRCFSRAQLIEQCLPESDALERVIDSHLSKLRRKLQLAGQEELIETVRSIGYRLWPGD